MNRRHYFWLQTAPLNHATNLITLSRLRRALRPHWFGNTRWTTPIFLAVSPNLAPNLSPSLARTQRRALRRRFKLHPETQSVTMATSEKAYDITIVGAGISGINFAYRLQERCPNLTYTILESRDAIGGTWDLFKYPGIRSDSDLYTFGFPWRPWEEQQSIAAGSLIAKYVRESAEMYGIDKKIQFGNHVHEANWDSESQAWELNVSSKNEGKRMLRTKFLMFCTGYYVRIHLSTFQSLR